MIKNQNAKKIARGKEKNETSYAAGKIALE